MSGKPVMLLTPHSYESLDSRIRAPDSGLDCLICAPDSGLDCLVCATFAQQRFRTRLPSQNEPRFPEVMLPIPYNVWGLHLLGCLVSE